MTNMINTSGRKVVVTVLIIATGFAVTLLRGDLPSNLLSLLEIIFAGFVSGNAVEHLARMSEARRKSAPEAGPASVLPPEISADQIRATVQALDARLASIEQSAAHLSSAQNTTNEAVGVILASIK